MAANRRIDRTMVHAGAAANAAQHAGELAAQQICTAIVDQHKDDFFRPLHRAIQRQAPPGRQHGNVVGNALSGRRARQQAHQGRQILQVRNDFLDAGNHHMQAWQGCHHAAIALIGHQRRRTGFRHQKIGAADAHIGREEMLAQDAARLARQRRDIALARQTVVRDKQIGHFFLGLVHRRRNDMGRGFPGQLNDVFAQIGLDRLDPGSGEGRIQIGLFREHRLRLDDFPDTMLPRQIDQQAGHLVAIARPQHFGAGRLRPRLEQFQPDIQIVDNPIADFLARHPHLLKAQAIRSQALQTLLALADKEGADIRQRFLHLRVAGLLRRLLLKKHGLRAHH
ncbi:MAG: hypothetical protein BWY57_01638 [Betaproteobacteria bacterium ADurb.Bin341]|nr:MAG: hypothetical protein BWY57_01638 [Betaproteobacteria bacterium ADurb.Bin341]